MSAFVRVHALQIRHVAHRCILRENAIRAKQPAGFTRDVSRDVDVVSLCQRHLLRRERSRVFQPAEVKGK